jgi:hypothetical protein
MKNTKILKNMKYNFLKKKIKTQCKDFELRGSCEELPTWAFIQILRTNSIILSVLDIHKQEKTLVM